MSQAHNKGVNPKPNSKQGVAGPQSNPQGTTELGTAPPPHSTPLSQDDLLGSGGVPDDPPSPPASGEFVQGTSEEEQAPRQISRATMGSEGSGAPDLYEVEVIVTPSAERERYEHNCELRDTLVRRLQWRQQQAAHFGKLADFAIIEDIRLLEKDIARLDVTIAKYTQNVGTRADRAVFLSEAQQYEALLALARIAGVLPEQIRLIDIVIGSVTLVVDMPLAGAARLVAMQNVNHPMLFAQGFARIAVDRVVDREGASLDSQFARAVLLAQSELMSSAQPSDGPSPYANVDATARMRVTLEDISALGPS